MQVGNFDQPFRGCALQGLNRSAESVRDFSPYRMTLPDDKAADFYWYLQKMILIVMQIHIM